MLVSTARENGVELDQSWTFRHSETEPDDVMVQITHLAPQSALADATPDQPTVPMGTTTDFKTALGELLTKGQDAGITFDRSWTFRDTNPDEDDVMVEITRSAKPTH